MRALNSARGVALAILITIAFSPDGEAREGQISRVMTAGRREVAAWDTRIEGFLTSGDLRLRQARPDTLLSGRVHERFAQLSRGVPVFGGELVRQSDAAGALTVFGTFYEGIDLDPRPTLSAAQARALVESSGDSRLVTAREPELVVLPEDGGGYALCWRLRAWSSGDLVMFFVDAHDGRVRLSYSDLKTQSAVGLGRGVLGDEKKISVRSSAGRFVTQDELRPPSLATYDYKGDFGRMFFALFGFSEFSPGDLAVDADNTGRTARTWMPTCTPATHTTITSSVSAAAASTTPTARSSAS